MSIDASLVFPKIPTYLSTDEYFQSKNVQNLFPKHHLDFDGAKLSKVRAHIANHEIGQRLLKALAKQKHAKNHHDRQWINLEETGKTLRSNIMEFQAFIRENEVKRTRKRAEVAHFREMQEKYDKRIKDLRVNMESLRSIRSKMEAEISLHGLYEEFTAATARESADFTSSEDVVKRYDILQETRRHLYHNQVTSREKLYESLVTTNMFLDETTLTQMGLHNEVGKLMGRYEAAKAKSLTWEKVLSAVQAEMHRVLGEVEMVKTSCRNVYLDVCARKNLTPGKEEDFQGQLKCIKEDLRHMKMALAKDYF